MDQHENAAGAAPVVFADIEAAARRLAGKAVRTPLLTYPLLDKALGFKLLVKAETLQLTGSFKFRGACNKLLLLKEREPSVKAVVAFSSGNHAQGVAAAAALLGFQATIVMPDDAPRIKMENTRSFGAEVVTYRRHTESREAIAAEIARKNRAVLVPPFDDPAIIAGQGTAGLELCEQAEAMGAIPDVVATPASGGGLVAGVATAVKHRFPRAEVYAAEPRDFDDHARSLKSGARETNPAGKTSICDALLSPQPGEITFAVNRRLLAGGLSASDEEILRVMRFALLRLKLVIEPGGAAALAGVLLARERWQGKTVAVVASGGNADPETLKRALDAEELQIG
ncbi:MAG TPA: threonine/serine dehydratase [Candidatus Cybelea sp.]|nr:threonine/serine dehydratase [Candidatus Cybelea sp.]